MRLEAQQLCWLVVLSVDAKRLQSAAYEAGRQGCTAGTEGAVLQHRGGVTDFAEHLLGT